MVLQVGRVGRSRKAKIGFFLIVCVVIAGAIMWVMMQPKAVSTPNVQQKTSVKKSVQLVGIESRLAVFGNAFWGRYTNDWAMASPLKYAYPFSRLNELHRDQYEAWIAGLECPTKPGVNMTSAQMEVALQFNCSPEYLPEAAKWFTAFTLANNHTDNQGEDGFAATREQLDKHGIQYFGHYDPRILDELCDVIALPVRVQQDDDKEKEGKLPVAFCGYHGVFRIPQDDALALMQRYSKVMPVFALPHMGQEYKPAPDELKTTLYRSMIDNGADAVLGDHPHWVQNTESYKGHLIVYSMGNFMFDQQDTAEVVRSAGIKVMLKTEKVDSELLEKWLKIGEMCSKYHDNCLQQAEEQNLTKLPVTFQFGVVATNDSGKITHAATPEQEAGILQRLNWRATMEKLQSPYSSL